MVTAKKMLKIIDIGLQIGRDFDVPVMINQWGIETDVTQGKTTYLNDMLTLMDEKGLHWTDWEWRNWGGTNAFGIIHNLTNKSVVVDNTQIEVFQEYIGG